MKIYSDERMADSGEESSWTFYIQGFMCDDDDDQNSSFFSDYETPSLVSDAASSAVKKFADDIHRADGNPGFPDGIRGNNFDNDHNKSRSMSILCKQNSFKKQKTKVPAAVMDHALEDTASSPANSPKISYMNEFINHKEKGKADVSQGKRFIFGKGGALNDHHVEKESSCTDLKKRTCDY